jgi:hypothetical protein
MKKQTKKKEKDIGRSDGMCASRRDRKGEKGCVIREEKEYIISKRKRERENEM